MSTPPKKQETRAGLLLKALNEAGGQKKLEEGTTYNLDKRTSVRIDQPKHGVGEIHAHTSKGVVKKSGGLSHGKQPFKLTRKEHDFLVSKGFQLKGRLVEESRVNSRDYFVADELPASARVLLLKLRADGS